MIDVARIDQWAASGNGPLHRASVAAKLLFVLLVVAAAVLSRDPYPLAGGCSLLLVIAVVTGLPWRSILLMAVYAALFSLLYAFSLHQGAWVYALVLLKSVTPALAVSMLIVTTPYPRIFSVLSAFLPEVVSGGLFMTYRSFFILLDLMDNFGTAIRLRGGFAAGNIVRNGANIAKGIGALLIKAVERSSKLYAVMAVRGYSGSMAESSIGTFAAGDWLPLGAGAAVLAAVLLW